MALKNKKQTQLPIVQSWKTEVVSKFIQVNIQIIKLVQDRQNLIP